MSESQDIFRNIDKSHLQTFLRKSDLWGWWLIIFNYSLIAFSFFIVAFFPNTFTICLSLILLGGRQLGLAILMHDASHDTLFKTKRLNRTVGHFLCAIPIFADLDRYRTYHLIHHYKTGTDEDPDHSNYANYPVSFQSFLRKVVRDLTGVTGLKTLILLYKMNAGLISYQLSYKTKKLEGDHQKGFWVALKHLWPSILFNFFLFILCFYFSSAYLYLLWPCSWMTTYMLFSRIRNAAEHASVPNLYSQSFLLNTRTTYASWWERLTLAPNFVNYHLEHHLLPSIPSYNLKKFHISLKEKGILDHSDISSSYIEVVKKLIS